MPGSRSLRWSVFLLCSSLAALGCSTDAEQGGSLALDLTIAGSIEIDSVSWEITGGDMEPMSGTIDTSAPGSTASVEVFGIPEGEDYLIEMTAESDGLMCKGSAFFDITVGEVTEVHVMLNCKRPERFGGVRVDGWFNICAELTKVVVSPLQTSVGYDIDLASAAVDEEGDDITYMWTGTGGSIADPMMAATTYTCQEAGDHSVTIKVSDDDFIYCVSEWTVAVTCVPSDGDLCEGVTCPDLGECKDNTCNPASGQCEESNVDNGTACGDGGMCMDGECVVGDLCEDVTCPDLGECKNNVCNPADGECEESNVDDGTACGDGGACMDGECIVDLCEGVTCPDTGNECTVGICNMQTGMCDDTDVPNGIDCNDNTGTCLEGNCVPNTDMCDPDPCVSTTLCIDPGTCNPSNGQCEGGGNAPINTACEDGGVCDGGGNCVACNEASQCSEDTNQCTAAACNDNVCGQDPVMDGTVCDDLGIGDGVCNAGACGPAPECTPGGDECNDFDVCTVNTCVNETCDTVPAEDGTSCDDAGDPGTCVSGICVGLCENVTCPDLGECKTNVCNPANGQCDESNVADGTACGDGGMCMNGDCELPQTTLSVVKTGPPAAFTNQEIEFTITVSNMGAQTATNVVLVDNLPDGGVFVSSNPAGSLNGDALTVSLGDILPTASAVVTVTWQTPATEGVAVNNAEASADDAAVSSGSHMVDVGIQTVVTGGVTAAGTGLRNRDNGDITITGVPQGAVVTRAVLVWALLYTDPVPGNQITFEGQVITADLTQTISEHLCWNDDNTIGYAADVTGLVSGNGVYAVTDPINGVVREDDIPTPVFPVTDGASLFVFYGGPGLDAQVLSDFSYSAENDLTTGENVRNISDITSTGGAAVLYLAGPDGQSFVEDVRVTGSGVLNFDDSWDGSDPQQGPGFGLIGGGSLWDTDVHDVSSILPIGQTTLDISLGLGSDCTGVSAVALEVQQ